ncbi:alpha/beta hydrolase [Streptomyces griseus]|uniref:alpha/beta hydrolase n=1 Tax=Streptomyces griseus TaxID=1911 RepID=UPI0034E0AE4E
MGTFTAYDGTTRSCRVTGKGEPLVCLTGDRGGADGAEELAGLAAHRTLVLLDARDPEGRLLPAAAVEDLRVHLGRDRIDLLGHGTGGDLAVRYAAVRPERVRSLALVTPGPGDPGPAHAPERARRALGGPTAPLLVLAGGRPGDGAATARRIAAFLDPAVREVAVGGVRLAHRATGPEGAPPVVLVHGRGESSATWAEVAAELAADHRVHAVDLRGHGLSDRPGGYGFADFAEELGGFLKPLGLTGATVVAHSMGAAAAQLLAGREPALIGRLVLEEPPALLPLDPAPSGGAAPRGTAPLRLGGRHHHRRPAERPRPGLAGGPRRDHGPHPGPGRRPGQPRPAGPAGGPRRSRAGRPPRHHRGRPPDPPGPAGRIPARAPRVRPVGAAVRGCGQGVRSEAVIRGCSGSLPPRRPPSPPSSPSGSPPCRSGSAGCVP